MVKVVLIVLLLAGCTTTSGTFCKIAKPQRPSPATIDAMTDTEVETVLVHNEKGRKLCGWKQ